MNEEATEEQYKNNIDFNELIKNSSKQLYKKRIYVLNGGLVIQNIDFIKNINIDRDIEYLEQKVDFREFIDEFDFKNIKEIRIASCRFYENFRFTDYLEFSLNIFTSTFKKELELQSISKENIYTELIGNNIKSLQASSCKFYNNFCINNFNGKENEIDNLKISNSEFYTEFSLHKNVDKNQINNLEIYKCIFYENFKVRCQLLQSTTIMGSDFKKNMDFLATEFLERDCKKSGSRTSVGFMNISVYGMTIFERCKFYDTLALYSVIFEGLVQFRSAEFFKGIELETTTAAKEMNFYDVTGLEKISKENRTSQETYRIIKYNFERIGNRIEANKYHALELEKKKENIKFKDNTLDWMVFQVNYWASRFGTNYGLAFFWILVTGFLTSMFIKTGNYYSFEYMFEYVNKWELFKEILANTPKYMSIINGDELKEYSVAFLLNKVLLGYLYYQFVTAVRKDTRK